MNCSSWSHNFNSQFQSPNIVLSTSNSSNYRRCANSSVTNRSPFPPKSTTEKKIVPYLHNLILELGQEEVHNLELLDGQRVQVDLLHAGDLAGLHETTELGDGLPFLLLLSTAATATTTATATATVTTARAKSSTSTGSGVSHFGCIWRLRETGGSVVSCRRRGCFSLAIHNCLGRAPKGNFAGGCAKRGPRALPPSTLCPTLLS